MEEPLDIQKPLQKIYNDKAIWVGTFLGGPLVAGYLITENFKAFEESEKVSKTWTYAFIATIIIFGGISFIPDTVRIPNQIIPIIYTAIVYYMVKHLQGAKINSHINAGGPIYSVWRAAGIGLIGTLITILIFIVIALFIG